jgi:hypothetical protein
MASVCATVASARLFCRRVLSRRTTDLRATGPKDYDCSRINAADPLICSVLRNRLHIREPEFVGL